MPAISALALVAGLAIAGCGSSSSSSSSSEAAPASAATTPAESSPKTASTPATTAPAAANGGGGSQTLALSANPEGQLKYSTTSLTAKAGKVSIDFTNMSPEGHNVTVASASGATVGATPTFQGSSKTLSLTLKPGTYKFFCTVPGHRMAGMEGTLTVH